MLLSSILMEYTMLLNLWQTNVILVKKKKKEKEKEKEKKKTFSVSIIRRNYVLEKKEEKKGSFIY